MNSKRLSAIFFVLILIVSFGSGHPAKAAPQRELTTPEELESFIDGLVAAQRDAYHIAGMTVSVVKDGELFFSKGYGYANVDERIPVSAEDTLFRAGSVSKLFTWTAVMQLVEQGMLDLDADINTYLDFQISNDYDQPLTLRHLMTHTPGFEDKGLGLFYLNEEELFPLEQYVKEDIPGQVYPPGEISAYSNYGATLASYIVEQVSGMSFNEYVEQNIFDPLGMEKSTFRQSLSPELSEKMSEGYLYVQGQYMEGGFEFVEPYPIGGLSTTAVDIAPFMIAYLQNGRYGNTRLLEAETVHEMLTVQFSSDPRLGGWGLGFSVDSRDGLRVAGHGGDTIFFHTEMTLLPDYGVGIFVSTNTDTGSFARFNFIESFLKRYYPIPGTEPPAPPEDFSQRAERYTGTYYSSRMNYSSFEKLLALIQPMVVNATGDGRLVVTGLIGPAPTYWVEVEPDLFRSESEIIPGDAVMIFQPKEGDDETGIQYVHFGALSFIKQPWYAAMGFQLLLIGFSLFVFLAALIAIPSGGLIHRFYRRTAPDTVHPAPLLARFARVTVWIFAFLNLIFWIVLFLTMSSLSNVAFGLPPFLEALMVVPWISAILAAAIVVFTVLAWLRSYWTLTGRIFYTAIATVTLIYIWFLGYWSLF